MVKKTSIIEKKTFFHLLVLAVLGAVVYSNTIHVPFIFDDEPTIARNPVIRDLSGLILNPADGRYNPGRFIAYLTFALNYKLNGFEVAGYHLFNISVHIINILLVYALITLTFKTAPMKESRFAELSGETAFFVSAFFAVSPLQTQAVTYIVQRMTSLAAMFYLSAVVLYIRARLLQERGRFLSGKILSLYILSIISVVLAMKTKEISFTLPISIALYEFLFFREREIKKRVALLPVLLTLLIIPFGIIDFSKPLGDAFSDVSEIASGKASISSSDYLFTQFSVIVTYLRLLFLPVNQNIDHDYPLYNSFFNVDVLLSFLFLLSLFAAALYMAIKSFRGFDPILRVTSFGIFWFFAVLSVESSVIPIVDVMVEHRVYLPSVGIFTALVTFIMSAGYVVKNGECKISYPVFSILIIALIMFSFLTFSRNIVWEEETRFWEDVVKKSPELARPHGNLGNAYVKSGKLEDAVREFKTAVSIWPEYAIAHYNLGNIYGRSGDFKKAIEELQTAVKLDPKYASPHHNLGHIYKIEGRIEEAISEYKAALQIEPHNPEIHFNFGLVYGEMGFFDDAIKEYKDAIKFNPDFTEAHNNLGAIYGKLGNFGEAIREFKTVKKLNPDNPGAYYNLGLIYKKLGRMDEASNEFRTADALRYK